jgi:hypothetical protein
VPAALPGGLLCKVVVVSVKTTEEMAASTIKGGLSNVNKVGTCTDLRVPPAQRPRASVLCRAATQSHMGHRTAQLKNASILFLRHGSTANVCFLSGYTMRQGWPRSALARGHLFGENGYMDTFATQKWHCPAGYIRVNLISCDPPQWFAPPTPDRPNKQGHQDCSKG